MAEQLLDDPQVGAARRGGGSRTSGGACAARRRAAGRPRGAAGRAGSAARARRAAPPRWFRKISPVGGAPLRPVGRRGQRGPGRPVLEVAASAARAGRPSSPIRSLRPLPRTRISPRRRSSDPSSRGGQLADPQARRRRPSRRSPGRAARARAGAPRSGSVGRGVRSASTAARRRSISLDLEDSRQPSRQAGRGDRAPRVAGREPLARGEAVERADGGESLGYRAPSVALAEVRQVGPQVAARRGAPVHARPASQLKVRANGRPIRALRVGRGVPGREAAQEALEGLRRRVTRRARSRSGVPGRATAVRLVGACHGSVRDPRPWGRIAPPGAARLPPGRAGRCQGRRVRRTTRQAQPDERPIARRQLDRRAAA